MKYNEQVWVIFNEANNEIIESGDNSLPLIFDNENDALDILDYFNGHHCLVVRKAIIAYSI